MERASQRVLSALAGLHGNQDWQVVKEWMKTSAAEDAKTLLIAKDQIQVRWLQGSVQTLQSILDTSEGAMAVMHRKRTE